MIALEVRSAGSEPADKINPVAIQAMAEEGIDIAAEQPKILTTEAVIASDVVITMGCGDTCPSTPANATRTGSSTTRPAKTLTTSDLFATRLGGELSSSLLSCNLCSLALSHPESISGIRVRTIT